MSWELLLTGVLLLAGWLWWDGLNKRELAIGTARALCQRIGSQFLDDSVALRQMRLARDEHQRVRIQRTFAFEYSDTGDNRLPGYVYLLGDRVVDVNMVIPANEVSTNE
jgi:hypothetical protein